jgi:hypothetical protein
MRLSRFALGLTLAWLLLCGTATAQNELDAFRYMTPMGVGTARALGMAGAFSAVGADFTATSLNPAGLGLYRKSEFMLTPTVRLLGNQSDYLDGTAQTNYGRFGFSNVGYVYADRIAKWNRETRTREEAESGLKSYAFSVGFNQLAALGRKTEVGAFNSSSSITEYFAAQANGMSIAELEADNGYAGQAWWAYAIDSSGSEGNYIGAGNGGRVQQDLSISELGRLNEWTVGFAANLDDKLYFGGTIGIQDLRYEQEMIFEERDINDVHNSWANDSTPYTSSTLTSGFVTKGTGFNLRLGVIAKPVDFMRVGLSVTTPTAVACTDRYYSEIVGYLDGSTDALTVEVPDGAFNYTLTTPFKVTAGTMVMFGKRGFVSADFDYLDYTTAKFKTPVSTGSAFYYSFNDENKAIRDIFAGAYNLRVGGELRLGPGRARLGYGHYGSILKREYLSYYVFPVDPVSPEVGNLPRGKQLFSAGLGFKQKSFYLDLAFTHEVSADRRLIYILPDPAAYSPELINRITQNNIYMTIGFTF